MARPAQSTSSTARVPLTPASTNHPRPPDDSSRRNLDYSPRSQRSARSAYSALTVDSWSVPTKGLQRSQSRVSNQYGSIGKRAGTPAAEYLKWDRPTTPAYDHPDGPSYTSDLDFHIHDDDNDAAYDGLENVRACCDGKHDVGSLSARHHHHHHHHNIPSKGTVRSVTDQPPRLPPPDPTPSRPGSPSGWSFRSGR